MGIFVAFSGRPARAAEGPLLVVVEAPPALDADAAEIRRAIGVELRAQMIAPMKRGAEPPERALIVAFDRDRITMSLRTNDGIPVVRDIPAPTDRAARLRAIAWLAGNLARDQVTPIVAEAPVDMPSLATIPAAPAVTPANEPPPLAVVPPVPIPPGSASDLPTISTSAQDPKISAAHFWTIGAADGPTSNFPLCYPFPGSPGLPSPCAPLRDHGTAWRIEVQRHSTSKGFFQGAALEGTAGSGFAPQLIGLSAFGGSTKRHGQWTFEPTLGAGLELSYACCGPGVVTSTQSSSNGFTSALMIGTTLRPALSAEGALALAHPVSDSLDALIRIGAHLSSDDVSAWYLSVTLGLRYNLL